MCLYWWRLFTIVVIWSLLQVPVRVQAAEFYRFWSLLIVELVRPCKSTVHWSIHVMTNALIAVTAASFVRDGLMQLILCYSWYTAWDTAVTCDFMDNPGSKITPRFLITRSIPWYMVLNATKMSSNIKIVTSWLSMAIWISLWIRSRFQCYNLQEKLAGISHIVCLSAYVQQIEQECTLCKRPLGQ